MTRRSFVKAASSAGAVLGTLPVYGAPSEAQSRAKSTILVWLWGAPSHLDTFDPKPQSPSDFRGPFSTIATRTPGVHFSELLPRLAERSDLFSVVRSHVTFAPGHPDAGTYGLTGFAETIKPVHPSFGSIVGKHRGQQGRLPPYVAVGNGIPRDVVRIVDGYGGGRMGKAYDPFMVRCTDRGQVDIPSLKLLECLSPLRLADRQHLLSTLDETRRTIETRAFLDLDDARRRALDLLVLPEAREAFDLSRESQPTREAYGQTAFGQSCLLARRLVEAGTSFVQVNWSEYVEAVTPNCDFGWDTHINNFELLQDRHGPIFDRAFSALLDDLHQRGLLKQTLVIAIGEFGRTPKINERAARDHWPRCYSSLWAGAGIAGGTVIGASDKRGEDPITDPITPLMVGTTIAELSGVGPQQRAELRVLDGGSVIREFV